MSYVESCKTKKNLASFFGNLKNHFGFDINQSYVISQLLLGYVQANRSTLSNKCTLKKTCFFYKS